MTQPGRARRPTMTDIGKLAGVSQSTVSLVINHMSGAKVSPETRAKVLRIARELGYPLRMEHAGPAPRPARNLIVYLTDELSTSPHAMTTIDGARDAAWEHDCLLSVYATRNDPEYEGAIIKRMLLEPTLLGVVYATIFTRAVTVPAQLGQVPTVLLNCHQKDRRERLYSSVVPSEVLGGYAAAMHLLDAGHRRIGFINGEGWIEAAAERLKGYRQALSSRDVPFDAQLVREGDWQVSSGHLHARALLGLPDPPSALFCANDLMAIGAIEAVREAGLELPRQVSVVGYDDQDIARYTQPPLTTVLLPNYEMGHWAAESLIAQVNGGVTRRTSMKMDCPLVERDSVAVFRAK